MGSGDILLGGNPAMDQYPVQGGVAILLGLLHATETGISPGRLGLSLLCSFTITTDCHAVVYLNIETAFSFLVDLH